MPASMSSRLRKVALRRVTLVVLSVAIRVDASSGTAGLAGLAAIDSTSRDAARGLGPLPASCIVVAAPLESDQAAPRGDALELRIAALLAGRIGAGATASSRTADLGSARALAGHASGLVYVQGSIVLGDLRLTVDLYPSTPNAWDRVRSPGRAPVAHAFARAKIDAEVRSYLAPLLLESLGVRRATHDEGEVLAVACGDVDGDGGNDLVLVSRSTIALGRIRTGTFVRERAVAWAQIALRGPVPSRASLASAIVTDGGVAVGWTDRGGVALGPDLSPIEPLAGLPVSGGQSPMCLTAQPAAGAFDGAPIPCAIDRDPKPVMAVPAPRFDAFAATIAVDPTGGVVPIVAVREPSGRLRVKAGDAILTPENGVGAQLAVLDLDQDGAPEVAVSADAPEDAIDIFTVGATPTELRMRVRLSAPSPVRALAVCPAEVHGAPSLVAVVGDEIWLVRAAPTLPASSAAETRAETR